MSEDKKQKQAIKGKDTPLSEKAEWLQQELNKKRIDWRKGCDWITVERSNLLEQSLVQIGYVDLYKVH